MEQAVIQEQAADGAAPAHRPPLDVRQGAAYLGVSVAKLWQLIRRGEVESFKIDGSRKIMPGALDAYLARQISAAQAERAAVAS
jgi:hypothetical protein